MGKRLAIFVAGVLILIIAFSVAFLILTRPTEPYDLGRQAVVPIYGSYTTPGWTGGGHPVTMSLALCDDSVTSLFGSPDNVTEIHLHGPDGSWPVTSWSWPVKAEASEQGAVWRHLELEFSTPDDIYTIDTVSFLFVNGMEKHLAAGQFEIGPIMTVPSKSPPNMSWNCFNAMLTPLASPHYIVTVIYMYLKEDVTPIVTDIQISGVPASSIATDQARQLRTDRGRPLLDSIPLQDLPEEELYEAVGLPLPIDCPSSSNFTAIIVVPFTFPVELPDDYRYYVWPTLTIRVEEEDYLVTPRHPARAQSLPLMDGLTWLEERGH